MLGLLGLSTILKFLYDFITTYLDLRRIEVSYSQALKFVRENLEEISFVINKLPEEIVVESTYKGTRTVSSRLLAFSKKVVKRLKKKEYRDIIVFSDMSYPEQIAFILKKVFEAILPFERVLSSELRETITSYYAYKFALKCEERVGKEVVSVLEREFQKTKYREIVLKLDSVKLEEKITLNPPPEVKPLLDRVIIPMLELRSREVATLEDVIQVEIGKAEMEKILRAISKGLIGVLFIGKKSPEEYLGYVNERIGSFRGLLVCSRGSYAGVYEKLIHERLVSLINRICGFMEVIEKRFEGEVEAKEPGKSIFHRYVLFIDKELLESPS